jgi:hypothetical protein
MMVRWLFTFAALGLSAALPAQFSAGFVAGMNFSQISGPSEMSDNMQELEKNTFKSGFHVGARFNYAFSRAFGVRAELQYSQKGTDYTYDGQSYWVFVTSQNRRIFSTGQRTEVTRVVFNGLETPLLAYARAGKLEIGAGAYLNLIFRAAGTGELRYRGISEQGATIDPFTIALDINYFNADAGDGPFSGAQTVFVDGEPISLPTTLGGNFSPLTGITETLYNRFDNGLIGHLAYYLNQGFSLGLRLNYGLSNLTRMDGDVAAARFSPERQPVFRDDFDRNVTLQASIGFNF